MHPCPTLHNPLSPSATIALLPQGRKPGDGPDSVELQSHRAQVFFFRPPLTAEWRGCGVRLVVYDCFYRTWGAAGHVVVAAARGNTTRLDFVLPAYWRPATVEVPLPPGVAERLPVTMEVHVQGAWGPTVLTVAANA